MFLVAVTVRAGPRVRACGLTRGLGPFLALLDAAGACTKWSKSTCCLARAGSESAPGPVTT